MVDQCVSGRTTADDGDAVIRHAAAVYRAAHPRQPPAAGNHDDAGGGSDPGDHPQPRHAIVRYASGSRWPGGEPISIGAAAAPFAGTQIAKTVGGTVSGRCRSSRPVESKGARARAIWLGLQVEINGRQVEMDGGTVEPRRRHSRYAAMARAFQMTQQISSRPRAGRLSAYAGRLARRPWRRRHRLGAVADPASIDTPIA